MVFYPTGVYSEFPARPRSVSVHLFEQSGLAGDSGARMNALESGNIVYLRESPLVPSREEQATLVSLAKLSGAFHKNIAYKPGEGRLSGLGGADPRLRSKIEDILRGFSQRAVELIGALFPSYREGWRIDYASFRPEEEEGRDLSWKKRNDLLHVDAFPTRPTKGGLILRVFVNVNPVKERVWVVSDPFEPLAERYANAAGLPDIARRARSSTRRARRAATRLLRSVGLPVVDRTPYDEFMLGFHDYLKSDAAYQANCAKYKFSFAPGWTWMVFTDMVPHSVLSGQHAIEQTFIVSRKSLHSPRRAPAAILERLSGAALTI